MAARQAHKTTAKAAARGPGRLSAEATAELERGLLDTAETIFIEQGYARSTVDAIARAAGATRKTVYARYANKEEIFAAVIERMLEQPAAEPGQAARFDTLEPRSLLLKLAHNLIAIVETPRAVSLSRLIYAEAYRSPELVNLSSELYARALGDVRAALEALRTAGRLPNLQDVPTAAGFFMELTVSTPRSRAILGAPVPPKQLAQHVEAAVDLFLRGYGP